MDTEKKLKIFEAQCSCFHSSIISPGMILVSAVTIGIDVRLWLFAVSLRPHFSLMGHSSEHYPMVAGSNRRFVVWIRFNDFS